MWLDTGIETVKKYKSGLLITQIQYTEYTLNHPPLNLSRLLWGKKQKKMEKHIDEKHVEYLEMTQANKASSL
jgi:hypothetical protein